MYLGYNVETSLGWIPAYDDETNVPAATIPNSFLTLRAPTIALTSPDTSYSTVLVYPLISSVGMIQTVDGSEVPVSDIASIDLGPSVRLMAPVSASEIPANAVIATLTIGVIQIPIAIICLAIIVTAGAFVLVSQYWTDAWVQAEYYTAQQAYYDYMTQCLAVISDESKDINIDGIPDIRTIVWANGKTVQLALSEDGIAYLDGETYVLEDEGTTVEPPAEPDLGIDFGWVLIAGIGLVGLFLVVKMFDRPSGGGGLMILKS